MANIEKTIFQPYLEQQWAKSGAITYGDRLEVIERLRDETKQGRIPIARNESIKLDANIDTVAAVRSGRTISVDGDVSTAVNGMAQTKKRNGIIAAILLGIVFGGGLLWFLFGRNLEPSQVPVVVQTVVPAIISSTATPLPTATATPLPTVTPLPTLTPTPFPTAAPIVAAVETAVPYVPTWNDSPTSLTLAGNVYPLGLAVFDDVWTPSGGAEWWGGTQLRRVFALPFDQNVLQAVFEGDAAATVRLRTGQKIEYQIKDIQKLNRYQTEVLSANSPSIAVLLYGETDSANDDGSRWVLIGDAVQSTKSPTINNDNNLNPTSWPTVGNRRLIVGDFSLAGASLSVHSCEYSAANFGRKLTCTVALRGIELDTLEIIDASWLGAGDVRPKSTLSKPEIFEGITTVRLSGVVSSDRNTPVIVWHSGGTDYGQLLKDAINNNPYLQPEEVINQ